VSVRVIQYYPRALVGDGGMTGAIRRLARALRMAGAETAIAYDAGPAPPLDDLVEWLPVRHSGTATQRLPDPRRLRDALCGVDAVVLNSAWTAHNVAAGMVASRMGVPYILAPRGAYAPPIVGRRGPMKRAWWLAFERRLVHGARAIHVFFDSDRDDLCRLGYQGDVLVAPNGVEAPPGLRWDGGSGGYVLWMGRFDPEHKGLDTLVRAVALLPAAERPQLRLHGPEWRSGKQRVLRMIAELGLATWVTVGDAVHGAEKWEILSRAAGFVYPSRWEGFGNSLAEAAALGVPVLATPYPLARLLAARGGAVLAEATPEAIADGLRRLLSTEAIGIGERAREVAAERLAWGPIGRTWLSQAETILAAGAQT
jgi:glycosyltransferase involved in cell wall biosynthesis